MQGYRPNSLRLRARVLCGLAAPVLVSLGGALHADEKVSVLPEANATNAAPVAAVKAVNLEACRQMALERAPAINAARASLGAAEARARAVDRLSCLSLFARDIPIRKKQACIGVGIGRAAVTQAEWDTLHGVTYCYLSYIYAYKQDQVAAKAVRNIKKLMEGAKAGLAAGNAKLNQPLVDRIGVYLPLAEGRREEAKQGMERALSALREAIGLDEHDTLELQIGEPELQMPPKLEEIRAIALARRGEMAQASDAAVVTCLEIEAQRRSCAFSKGTFAAGSDIHAREVPQGFHDETYRPGALGLEMPVLLPGKRKDRIQQAHEYHQRAEVVVEKTRKLIALEAEQAFIRWQEAATKAGKFEKARDDATGVYFGKRSKEGKREGGLVEQIDAFAKTADFSEILTAGLLATDMAIEHNKATYQAWLNLAAIERATAGGYCPSWALKPVPPIEDETADDEK